MTSAASVTRTRILRITDETSVQCSPLNQFSLPLRQRCDITFCTYFKVDIPLPDDITLLDGDGTLWGFFRTLREAVHRTEYDVVHVHSPHVGAMFVIACLFMRQARRLLHSSVYTIHSCYAHYKFRNKALLLFTLLFFRRVVCCSRASYESLPSWAQWFAHKRLLVIPNGVDLHRVDSMHALEGTSGQSEHDPFTIIVVGRLTELKGPSCVLSAFKRIADGRTRLVFVGEGPLRASLTSQVAALGLQACVEFTGEIARNAVYQRLLAADMFVSASHKEGLPLAVLEAMACTCPAVLSDIPPHREIAANCDLIPLVPIDDVSGFAAALKKCRDMPAAQRAHVGQSCRLVVEQRFSLDQMLSSYTDVYTAVGRRGSARKARRAAQTVPADQLTCG